MQRFVASHEANPLAAVTQIVDLLMPVLKLDDPRLTTQLAPGAQFGHTAFDVLAIDHETLPCRADDKTLTSVQQGFQQFLSVTASIHGPDPTALRVRPEQIDTRQRFRVFTEKLFSFGRVQLLIERNDFTAVPLRRRDIAQPVA